MRLIIYSLILAAIFLALISEGQTTKEEGPSYTGSETQIVEQILEDEGNHPFIKDAKLEYTLWDKTRVDALTSTHAIEADWSYKWAEAIGQSLYYAEVTGKKPGIILLIKDEAKEQKYIYRCQTVANKHGIEIWLIETHKEESNE